MNQDQFNFAAEHLANIANLKEVERNFYNEIHKRVTIESGFENIRVKHENWEGTLSVLRFSRSGWHELHDCVLILSGTDELMITVMAWVYADGFYLGNKAKL